MSLINCKECKKPISSAAKACPNCGHELPKGTSGLTWIIAIIFGVSIIMAIVHSGDAEEAEAKRLAAMTPEQRAQKHDADQLDSARYACEEFVKKTLHDPDSAEFDPASRYYAQKAGDGDYLVQVTVRAKNGFGALRHITVNCNTRPVQSGWVAVAVKEIS